MRIGLRAGHSDNCQGAVGIVNEHEQMKKYYLAIRKVLEQYGHTVIDCNSNANTENKELTEGANKANNAICDIFASLHMNCFNGSAHGTEVVVSSENSNAYPYAKRLVNNFAELGFVNRGVKFQRLYEMNHIRCGNLISEICFCDNKEDIDIYNKYSWEKLAYVFCNAIDSNIPKEPPIEVKKSDKGYVVTGYFPKTLKDYKGIDLEYINEIKDKYFKNIKVYIVPNDKGLWIETQYLTLEQCNKLKESLGSWFYEIKED